MFLDLTERLLFSTVRLESTDPGGQRFAGTGFFVDVETAHGREVGIVTNRHVVKGAQRLRMPFTRADGRDPQLRSHVLASIDSPEEVVRWHPDRDVDLCFIPLASILENLDEGDRSIYFRPITGEILDNPGGAASLRAIESVVMVGYPLGVSDAVNNLPVVRTGITATHPALDYNGEAEFLIDAQCLPGSSGSPVFLFDTWGHVDKAGNVRVAERRAMLLGVLRGVVTYDARGVVHVVDAPGNTMGVASLKLPTLGSVIKSRRVLEMLR